MKTESKVRFRVITPSTWSDLTGFHPQGTNKSDYKAIETLEEAKRALEQWGTPDGGKESEYYDYWQEQKKLCKIVRETTIVEEEITSEMDFLALATKGIRSDAITASCWDLPVREGLTHLEKSVFQEEFKKQGKQLKTTD